MPSRIFKKILVAVDGSEVTEEIIDYAIEIAKLSDAELYILHMISISAVSAPGPAPVAAPWIPLQNILREEGEKILSDVEKVIEKTGVPFNTEIQEGNPAEGILKYASEIDVDLIIIGTIGKSKLEKILIGSVTQKVLQLSTIPVLSIKKKV